MRYRSVKREEETCSRRTGDRYHSNTRDLIILAIMFPRPNGIGIEPTYETIVEPDGNRIEPGVGAIARPAIVGGMLDHPGADGIELDVSAELPKTAFVAVADAAGIDTDAIRRGRGGASRMLVAWFGWYEGSKRLRQIAASLRLRSTGHVSNLIRQCDRELRADAALQRIADQALAVLRPPPVIAPF